MAAAKKKRANGRAAAKQGGQGSKASARKSSTRKTVAKRSGSKRAGGAAQAASTPTELLLKEIRQIYSAESQLMKALPRLAKQVSDESLAELLEERMERGERLVAEIEEALDGMGERAGRVQNAVAEALIEEAAQATEGVEGAMFDAVLVGSVQKAEHYCIAAWGTARAFAEMLEEYPIADAMQTALDEGKKFDAILTRLAERELNPAMAEGGEEEEEEEVGTRGASGRVDGGRRQGRH